MSEKLTESSQKVVGKCVCCQKIKEIVFPICNKECLKNEWRSQHFLHLAEVAKRGGKKRNKE